MKKIDPDDTNRGFTWEIITNDNGVEKIKIKLFMTENDILVGNVYFDYTEAGWEEAYKFGDQWTSKSKKNQGYSIEPAEPYVNTKPLNITGEKVELYRFLCKHKFVTQDVIDKFEQWEADNADSL